MTIELSRTEEVVLEKRKIVGFVNDGNNILKA